MDRERILKAVKGYVGLIEKEGSPTEEELNLVLDELALASNLCRDFDFDEEDYPEPPDIDQIELRDMVFSKFPDYGLYNLPVNVADHLGETEIMLGGANQDLQEIYMDLKEIEWCWENNSVEDALWHFHFGYENHWGAHLRNLQWYLYVSRYEGVRY